jgi:hypothetical protein
MSHIVVIKTEVRDVAAVEAACRRLGLGPPRVGKARLFSEEAEGVIVQLTGWQYPIVCDTTSGEVKLDNFGGCWGDQRHFDRFMQMYAVEKAKIEARKRGNLCTEQSLPDGSIKLTIRVQGDAA